MSKEMEDVELPHKAHLFSRSPPTSRARRSRTKTLASSSPSRHPTADESSLPFAIGASRGPSSLAHSSLASNSSNSLLSSDSSSSPSSSGSSLAHRQGPRIRATTVVSTTSSPALLSLNNKISLPPTPAPPPSSTSLGKNAPGSPTNAKRGLRVSRSPQPQRRKPLPPISSLPSSPSNHASNRWLDDAYADYSLASASSSSSGDNEINIFSPRVDDDRVEDWDFLRKKRNEDMGNHEMRDRCFSSSVWCNVCKRKIKGKGKQRQGKMCTVCRYVTHFECEHDAERNCPTTFSVYPLPSTPPEEVRRMEHAWIEGNHPSHSCIFCSREVSGRDMVGSRCYWCLGVAHNECRDQNQGVACDFGELRTLKLPPYAIYRTGKEEPELAWQLEPSFLSGTDCKPLLVFINRMSGGQQGPGVIQRLSSLLNPNQIVDIRQGGPAVGLNMFMPLIEKANGFRVLICGGDGTVNWVCTALAKIQFPTEESVPQLGLLPLGTGNDLSGFLGWGTGYTGGDLHKIIERMNVAVPIKLDRWKVRIMETAILKGSKIISFKKKHTPASSSSSSASVASTPVASDVSVDNAALLRSAPPKMTRGNDLLDTPPPPASPSLVPASSPPTSPPPQRRPHSPAMSARKLDFGCREEEEQEQEALSSAADGHRNPSRQQPQRKSKDLDASISSGTNSNGSSLAASPSTPVTGMSPRRGLSPRKPLPQLPRSFSTMAAINVPLHNAAVRSPRSPASSSLPALPPLPSVSSAVPTSPPSPATVARNEAKRGNVGSPTPRDRLQFEGDEKYDAIANGVDKTDSQHSDRSNADNDSDDDTITTTTEDSSTAEWKKGKTPRLSSEADGDADGTHNDDDDGGSSEDEEAEEEDGRRSQEDERLATLEGLPGPIVKNKEDEESDTVSLKSFHHSFSIGVDAKISMAFHLAREANPDAFTSRGMNKFKYFTQGINSILEGGCKNLSQGIEFIAVDDNIIRGDELPSSIESIVFSNIPAYADGTDLWGSARPMDNMKPQKVDDKIIEVVAHKGSIHLIQIKAGVSKSIPLGQGRKVKLQTKAILPMQLDGEPWLQGPALIEIEHFSQVKMLVPVKKKQRLTHEGKCDH